MSRQRLCIVGAGASGLPTLRHALGYSLDVVCYEAQDDIGGLWRFKPEKSESNTLTIVDDVDVVSLPDSSVMRSTVMNTSKELNAYSDFPPDPAFSNHMHNTQILQYMREYAEHHHLLEHINFLHKASEVYNIERRSDYERTGCWHVTVTDLRAERTWTETFDFVLLCMGHHQQPLLPDPWPGQENFRGRIIHTKEYKDASDYEDKVVVIVGVGNSGIDAATEISRVARQWTPAWLTDWLARRSLNRHFNHKAYGIEPPRHRVNASTLSTNAELPARLGSGAVIVRPGISRFTERGVVFVDGSEVDDVDAVILGTGYAIEFPMLEYGTLLKVEDNDTDLYQFMFPLVCTHDTLALIGHIQIGFINGLTRLHLRSIYFSGIFFIMPISEMQARLALQSDRQLDICRKRKAMAQYGTSHRHKIMVDYISYMDELSAMIGANPPAWYSLLCSDPLLALHLLLSPHSSYFYRLRGPGVWTGARDAILGIEDRMAKAAGLQTAHWTTFTAKNPAFVMSVYVVFGLMMAVAVVLYRVC